MIVTCEKCFSADDVAWQRLPDKMVLYTCSAEHEGAGPHSFVRAAAKAADYSETVSERVTDDLLDPLMACIEAGEPLLEYGIVEYRLRQRYPRLFREHVADRGHFLTGATVATASSVRFGVALGRLAAGGQFVSDYGKATGAWKYNGEVTYWARPPKPVMRKTRVEYCVYLNDCADDTGVVDELEVGLRLSVRAALLRSHLRDLRQRGAGRVRRG